jgi:uncharacterized protein YceK
MVRSLLALLLICVLTGCSTVANNLSPEQIAGLLR